MLRRMSFLGRLVPFLLIALLLATVARSSFWSSSFFLDETISQWIVSGSIQDLVDRSLDYQGQSPFYFTVLSVWQMIMGTSERWGRMLSVLLIGSGLLLLARRLGTPSWWSLWMLVVLALAHDGVQRAFGMRPYGMLFFCSAFTVGMALQFLRSGRSIERQATLLLFFLATATHPLAYLAAPVFLLSYGGHRFLASRQDWILLLCAGIPVLQPMLALDGAAMQIVARSHVSDLIATVAPIPFLVILVCSLVLSLIFAYERPARPHGSPAIRFLALWWVVPLILLAFASILGIAPFVPRYAFVGVPGLLGFVTLLLAAAFHSPSLRRVVLGSFAALALLREVDRRWDSEGWREVVSHLEVPGARIALGAGLVEAEDADFRRLHPEYLAAPLRAYGFTAGEIVPIPLQKAASDVIAELRDIRPSTDRPLLLVWNSSGFPLGETPPMIAMVRESFRASQEPRCFGAVCLLRIDG